MKTIEHRQPFHVAEEGGAPEDYAHKLDLVVDGERVGYAELVYKNHPFPFYYVAYVHVDPRHQGQRYGSDVLEALNRFLATKGKSGLLHNIIDPYHPAHGFYERHGWEPIVGEEQWYIYNPPRGLTKDRIASALYGLRGERSKASSNAAEAA